jgi:uncharacterized protein (DUF427 family)
MGDYPQMIAPVDHIEPVPRRIRAVLAGRTVLDTIGAVYVWEWPYYPQYCIPFADVNADLLVDEQHPQHLHRGTAQLHGLRVGEVTRPSSARLYGEDAIDGLAGMVRFEWDALDAWFEEDEQVFVHPRNPYVRVDALRSTRKVRIGIDGAVLAESGSPVMVFETGLPTRYYLPAADVRQDALRPSETHTRCPYKGVASYHDVVTAQGEHPDLVWYYPEPIAAVENIRDRLCFYNEKVSVYVDDELEERPQTKFS